MTILSAVLIDICQAIFAECFFLQFGDQMSVIFKGTWDHFTAFVCPIMNCLHQWISVFAHSFPLKARLMGYEAQDS